MSNLGRMSQRATSWPSFPSPYSFFFRCAAVIIVDGHHRADRGRGSPKIQFHQFSTGSKHPSAANYCVGFDQILTARATRVECCGDNMVAVILDGEKMGGRKGDYVFLIEWKIGRITQASSLTIQHYRRPNLQTRCERWSLERMVLWSPFCPVISSFLPYETPLRFNFAN